VDQTLLLVLLLSFLHLLILVVDDDLLYVGDVFLFAHNGYLIDQLIVLKHIDGMLDDLLARYFKKLLGQVAAQPAAASTG